MNTPLANSHQIEPELLRGTPRPVHSIGGGIIERYGRIFLVPLILTGIASLLAAILTAVGVLYAQLSGANGHKIPIPSWDIPSMLSYGFVGLLVWQFYVPAARARKLVERGVPTVGRITNKTIAGDGAEGSDVYYLHYEYAPIEYATNGPKLQGNAFASQSSTFSSQPLASTFKGKTALSEKIYNAIQTGSTVTVLFDANHPERSLLYRFANYKVAA